MFDSLDEQLKLDARKSTSNAEQTIRWVLVAVISVLVFGGLYWVSR